MCSWAMMDYGFINIALLWAVDITPADDAFLKAQTDVYAFPANLDAQITDKARMDVFFEPINVPTDWLTPSSTYRQFLRSMAGLMQFNQRYGAISTGQSLLGNGITLNSNWNGLSAQQKSWFNQTVASFGYTYTVSGNPKLRTLSKQAGDLWGSQPFFLGGYEF